MKYFMTVYSIARQADRHFEMTLEQAKYYYQSWMEQDQWLGNTREGRDAIIAEAMKNGSEIRAPKTKPAHMKIWGADWSDAELFRRRVKGEIDKERLDDF